MHKKILTLLPILFVAIASLFGGRAEAQTCVRNPCRVGQVPEIRGPAGARGPAGPAGARGETGATGPAGPASCTGAGCLVAPIYFQPNPITVYCNSLLTDCRALVTGGVLPNVDCNPGDIPLASRMPLVVVINTSPGSYVTANLGFTSSPDPDWISYSGVRYAICADTSP